MLESTAHTYLDSVDGRGWKIFDLFSSLYSLCKACFVYALASPYRPILKVDRCL